MKQIRRDAKKDGMKVVVKSSPLLTWSGGVNVYVHPKYIKGDLRFVELYFSSWFAEVSESCVC
jgi:hypothetical protein